MKCQILVSGKNKKNIINLSSAENAQRVVKVKISGQADDSHEISGLVFFEKLKRNISKCRLLQL